MQYSIMLTTYSLLQVISGISQYTRVSSDCKFGILSSCMWFCVCRKVFIDDFELTLDSLCKPKWFSFIKGMMV